MLQIFEVLTLSDWVTFLQITRTTKVTIFVVFLATTDAFSLARFMPNPLSTGHLQLSFPTHPPPRSHLPLCLLRPSHFPLAVIGVAVCTQVDSLAPMFSHFNASLDDIFHPDGVYPLARNCFVFEEGDDTNLNLGSDLPGLVVIPSVMGNKKLYIGTLLADLCSQILGEFGVVVYVFLPYLFYCSHRRNRCKL
jgi:hypothetical protein